MPCPQVLESLFGAFAERGLRELAKAFAQEGLREPLDLLRRASKSGPVEVVGRLCTTLQPKIRKAKSGSFGVATPHGGTACGTGVFLPGAGSNLEAFARIDRDYAIPPLLA